VESRRRSSNSELELIILLAHKLKLKVLAEGIETARYWEHLRELGCEFGPGYYFSQPMEPKVAGELLRDPASLSQAKVAGT
jgi:EAL domain-containing protein (putative c-di-GMP-specific phosphodiesterase class I)